MSADQRRREGLDLVALFAGVIFVLFSIVSLTVGIWDLPDLGAAPLWVILITVGSVLLVSELRGRGTRSSDPATSSDSTDAPGTTELQAWEQDPYR